MKHIIDKILDAAVTLFDPKSKKYKGGTLGALLPGVHEDFYKVLEQSQKNPIAIIASAERSLEFAPRKLEHYKKPEKDLPEPDAQSEEYSDEKLNGEIIELSQQCELKEDEKTQIDTVKGKVKSLFTTLKQNFMRSSSDQLLNADQLPKLPTDPSIMCKLVDASTTDSKEEQTVFITDINSPQLTAPTEKQYIDTLINEIKWFFAGNNIKKLANARNESISTATNKSISTLLKGVIIKITPISFNTFLIYFCKQIATMVDKKIKDVVIKTKKSSSFDETRTKRLLKKPIIPISKKYTFIIYRLFKEIIHTLHDDSETFFYDAYSSLKTSNGYEMNDFMYIIMFYNYLFKFLSKRYDLLFIDSKRNSINHFLHYRLRYCELFIDRNFYGVKDHSEKLLETVDVLKGGANTYKIIGHGEKTDETTDFETLWPKINDANYILPRNFIEVPQIPFAINKTDYDKDAFKSDLIVSLRCLYELTEFFKTYEPIYKLLLESKVGLFAGLLPKKTEGGDKTPTASSGDKTPTASKRTRTKTKAKAKKVPLTTKDEIIKKEFTKIVNEEGKRVSLLILSYLNYIYDNKLKKIDIKGSKLSEAKAYCEKIAKYIYLFNYLYDFRNKVKAYPDTPETEAIEAIKNFVNQSGEELLLPSDRSVASDAETLLAGDVEIKKKIAVNVLIDTNLGELFNIGEVYDQLKSIDSKPGADSPSTEDTVAKDIKDIADKWVTRVGGGLSVPEDQEKVKAWKLAEEAEAAERQRKETEEAAERQRKEAEETEKRLKSEQKAAEAEAERLKSEQKAAEAEAERLKSEQKAAEAEAERQKHEEEAATAAAAAAAAAAEQNRLREEADQTALSLQKTNTELTEAIRRKNILERELAVKNTEYENAKITGEKMHAQEMQNKIDELNKQKAEADDTKANLEQLKQARTEEKKTMDAQLAEAKAASEEAEKNTKDANAKLEVASKATDEANKKVAAAEEKVNAIQAEALAKENAHKVEQENLKKELDDKDRAVNELEQKKTKLEALTKQLQDSLNYTTTTTSEEKTLLQKQLSDAQDAIQKAEEESSALKEEARKAKEALEKAAESARLSSMKTNANKNKMRALTTLLVTLLAKAKVKLPAPKDCKDEPLTGIIFKKIDDLVARTTQTIGTSYVEEEDTETPVANYTQTEKNIKAINDYFKKKIFEFSESSILKESCADLMRDNIHIIEYVNNDPENTTEIDNLTASLHDLSIDNAGDKFKNLKIAFKVSCNKDKPEIAADFFFEAIIDRGKIETIRPDGELKLKPLETPKGNFERKKKKEPEPKPEEPEPEEEEEEEEEEPEPEPSKKNLATATLSIVASLVAAAKAAKRRTV